MRAVCLTAFLAVAVFGRPAPAAGNPFAVGDLTSSVDAPVDVVSDLAVMDLDGTHTAAPATCAHEIGHDPSPAANLNPVPFPMPAPAPLEPSDSSGVRSESDSMTTGEGASLISGLLNCGGAATPSLAARAGLASSASFLPSEPTRWQSAVQAGAITAGLVLVTWLGFLVAAMTRRSSHAHAGRRRY
jgi:hypothetical protein